MKPSTGNRPARLKRSFAPGVWTMLSAIGFAACFTTQAFAVEDTAYERKSVSYVDRLIVLTDLRVPEEQAILFTNQVRNAVVLDRFDYNPLPGSMIREFQREVRAAWRREGRLDEDIVSRVLEYTLLESILDILEAERLSRAEDLVEDWQRETFAVRKAKELGVTEDELVSVMNAAYICIPFVIDFGLVETGETVTVSVHGGVSWYHVDNNLPEPRVVPMLNKVTSTVGHATKGRVYSTMDGPKNAREYAAWSAINTFASNIGAAVRRIREFHLVSPAVEVEGSRVKFRLGRREGLSLDDRLYSVEYLSEGGGRTGERRAGFIRTIRVGDNRERNAFSTARIVGGRCEIGMLLVENPRMGVDIGIAAGSAPLAVDGGYVQDPQTGMDLDFYEDMDRRQAVFSLDARYNLAPRIGISQLFAGFDWGIGFVNLDLGIWEGHGGVFNDNPPLADLQFLDGYLLKKFWIGRAALTLAAGASWNSLGFRYVDDDGDEHLFEAANIGFRGDAGFEYALTANLVIGAGAVFRVSEPVVWTVSGDGFGRRELTWPDAPEVDFSGTGFNIWLSYSPPSLGIDPFSLLRGRLGI